MNNFHTHTSRCLHAAGRDEEYVLAAIDHGIHTLGFSDHTPWHYDSGFKPFMRMQEDELESYVHSISTLRETYKDQIEILIGLEVEWFPDKMPWLIQKADEFGLDYFILGHHYDTSDETGIYYGSPGMSLRQVQRYTSQVLEGMESGQFAYVAHPDVIYYNTRDPRHVAELEKICVKAKELNLPLEYNMLGREGRRHYPSEPLLKLAKKHDNTMIIGFDAHTPDMFGYTDDARLVLEGLHEMGIRTTGTIRTRR